MQIIILWVANPHKIWQHEVKILHQLQHLIVQYMSKIQCIKNSNVLFGYTHKIQAYFPSSVNRKIQLVQVLK